MSEEQITEEEMTRALQRSGYLLESRCARILRAQNYFVHTNATYIDRATGTSRELDVLARQVVLRDEGGGPQLMWNLLIECANNHQPVIFFMQDADDDVSRVLRDWDHRIAGIPGHLVDPTTNEMELLQTVLRFSEFHHYSGTAISRQWCSFKRNKEKPKERDWIAVHPDAHNMFGSLMQAVESYEVAEFKAAWNEEKRVDLRLLYPLIVLQGEMSEAWLEGSSVRLKPSDHVRYLCAKTTSRGESSFLVDVVTEKYLPEFLRMLDAEVGQIAERVTKHALMLKAAGDVLRRKAEAAQTWEERLTILNWNAA